MEGHSHPIYLTTRISPITRYIFLKKDDTHLNYLNEGGKSVEPENFVPIIPMVLVNGCEAIVNRLFTFIPKCDPRVIIANLKSLLVEGRLMEAMKPYYKGFKGKIKKMELNAEGKEIGYYTEGIVDQGNDASIITISELPVRRWTTEGYKERYLDPAVEKEKI